jgi:tRNA pseudouridine55 synthase
VARRRRKNDSGAEGVLLVDKPVGPTSHDVVGRVRRALGTRRVGHAGTLDPLASGLLVVLVGRYTKLSSHLTGADKAYEALVRFGARTTTDDAEGDVVESADPSGLDEAAVRAAVAARVGEQDQVPPAYSAVQIDGERLYARARRGEEVEAPPRRVTVRSAELTSWTPPTAHIEVECSKGTYIRSLARDLGVDVGVPAHLAGLRRTRSGAYDLTDAVKLEDIATERLLIGPEAVRGIARVDVDDEAAERLKQGQAVPTAHELRGEIALAVHDGQLLALVHQDKGALRVTRGLWS